MNGRGSHSLQTSVVTMPETAAERGDGAALQDALQRVQEAVDDGG